MKTKRGSQAHFGNVVMAEVPRSRNGKHKKIVDLVLDDLQQLKSGTAMKIPLEALGDTKANVRSALNRASKKTRRRLATAADDKFLYVWNLSEGEAPAGE